MEESEPIETGGDDTHDNDQKSLATRFADAIANETTADQNPFALVTKDGGKPPVAASAVAMAAPPNRTRALSTEDTRAPKPQPHDWKRAASSKKKTHKPNYKVGDYLCESEV